MKGIIWAYQSDGANEKLLEIEEQYARMDIKPIRRVINTIIKPATKAMPYQAFRFYLPSSYDWTREDEEIEAKYI